jgi:glycosyltransferase involved in cell wall biosynthesis
MAVVSVLIPVRNTGRWIAETIASVQAQTVGDWKLFVIDDGSTDNTAEVMTGLAKHDERITFVSRENRGLVTTRNELLAMADSEFIAWIDSDDRMTPERLQVQLDRFSKEPNLICLGGAALLIDPNGLPIKTHAFPTDHESLCKIMEEDIAFYFPSVSMRRDAAVKVGGFRHPLSIGEDYDIALRMAEVGRVGNVPEVILHYRQHLASTANSGRAKTFIFAKLVRELAEERRTTGTDRIQRGETIELNWDNLPAAKQVANETHIRWGWWALQAGNLATARKYARQSVLERPFSSEPWRLLACSIRGR